MTIYLSIFLILVILKLICTASFEVFGGKTKSQLGQFIFMRSQVNNAENENIHYNFSNILPNLIETQKNLKNNDATL